MTGMHARAHGHRRRPCFGTLALRSPRREATGRQLLHADRERAACTGTFVDIVWIYLFPLLYLIRSIGEQGFVLREAGVDRLRHGDFRYLAVETAGVDVRRYDKTAIVRCVQRSRASWRGQGRRPSPSGWSQVWVQQPGGWRLAALQFSTLGSG